MDKEKKCYLPNAAIGWKQPNGFYYPPAFHSQNLFFNNVDIRHFVIEPLLKPDTYFSWEERGEEEILHLQSRRLGTVLRLHRH